MTFKDTSFGKIPDTWGMAKISEITKVVTDYVANGSFASLAQNVTYKDEEDVAVLIRLVDYNNDFKGDFVFIDEHAYEFLAKSKLYGGEIIISNVGANVGTVFRCPYLNYKMSLAPNAIMVRFIGNDSFYYHWLKGHYGQKMLKSIVTGSAQPKFNKTNFRDMLVPVPPIDVQDRIAAILDSIEQKIEQNTAINENLEQQAQAIFKSWFVDFEPFGGIMPADWTETTLNDVCKKITDGSHYSPKNNPSASIPMLSVKDMLSYGFSFQSCKHIDEDEFQKMVVNDCVPLKDDILVAKDGSYLKEIFICNCEQRIAILSSIAIFRPNTEIIIPEILLALLKSPTVLQEVKDNYVSGSALPRIVLKDFKKLRLILPSIKVQEQVAPILHNIRLQIDINCEENQRLAALRDTLLPKLMSGEIDVSKVKI